MSVETETTQVRRELPTTTLQLAGHTATEVVGGLSGRSPWMLGILLLNITGVAAAVYFLNLLIQGQQNHLASLLEVQNRQQTEIVQMHQREFDALLAMAQKEPIPPTVVAPVAPIDRPLTPPPAGRR